VGEEVLSPMWKKRGWNHEGNYSKFKKLIGKTLLKQTCFNNSIGWL
jgi:hypothetical protein